MNHLQIRHRLQLRKKNISNIKIQSANEPKQTLHHNDVTLSQNGHKILPAGIRFMNTNLRDYPS